MSLWVGLLMVAAGLFVMAWVGWRLCEAHYEQDRDETSAEGCPTCNGERFIVATGTTIRTRETVGLVCQTCGTDYGALDDD